MQPFAPHIQGLTSAQVEERRRTGRRNIHVLRPMRSYGQIVWANVFSLYNVVLFASFIALFAIRGPGSAVFPAGVVLANVVLGLIQELRAKRALDKLAALSVRTATVRRAGRNAAIPVEEIVQDDVLELHPGDSLPVDGPLLASDSLQMDESQLTGESEYILKEPGSPLTSGSFCVSGIGLMQAERIGAASFVNHLANVARAYKHIRSPLERSLDALIELLVPLTIVLAPLTLISGQLRGLPLGDSLENVVNLISSLVPQGLIVFVSISFAYGVIRISRFQALIQRPNAVELAGQVRYLCADKTGTLTRNVLSVKEILPLNGVSREAARAGLAAYLANVSWQNRTAAAIASYIGGQAVPRSKVAEVPFTSERKWGSVTLSSGETLLLGAPEIVLASPDLLEQARELAVGGMRVIAFAASSDAAAAGSAALPAERHAVALIALQDELRPNIRETLSEFARQGVAIKIISGDGPETVMSIARQAGMRDARLVTEQDLEGMDAPALERTAVEAALFARIKPPTKRLIIAALARHAPVAMIGDGVNDVPALKQASLAIAMNDGAQIAKDVSDVILLNNDFSTLPRALFEGRELTQRLYGIARINLVKVLYLTLLFILIGYSGLPWPASLLQTTWLSLITLTAPAMLIIFRVLPIPQGDNRTVRVMEYLVVWGMAASAALIAMDVFAQVYLNVSVALARTMVIAFAGLYNSLVLWDIYGVRPFAPGSLLRSPRAALAGLLLGLISALVPSYLIPQMLGLAPMGPREVLLVVLALALAYASARYFSRHLEQTGLRTGSPPE